MKIPWYLKIEGVNLKNTEFVNITFKVNPWYMLYEKLKLILTMKIWIKFKRGIQIKIELPGG